MKHYTEARTDKLYYLASPYSHKNQFIQVYRYEAVIYAAATLTKMGFALLEPIGMSHEQSTRYELPGGYEFWQTRDRTLIDHSDGVIVLRLPGWKNSVGVRDELEYCSSQGKPIYYIDLDDLLSHEEIDLLSYGCSTQIRKP